MPKKCARVNFRHSTAKFFSPKPWWQWLLYAIACVLLFLMLLQIWYALHIVWWKYFNPSSTAFMRTQQTRLAEKVPDFKLKHQWVDYAKISVHLKRAVIASEDSNFAEHEGVDWEAIQQARAKNKKKGKFVAGGSTITQQLAKNLFLSADKSYFRKGEELIISWMLETALDKERIFEIYLNVVEWGEGVFGAEAGARHHYGISAAQLGAEQAARMAVMLPNPRFFDKHRGSHYLAARTQVIVRRMSSAELP